MSKKKGFSKNTMSLKDFHGGSIPTDLPLPSAPGVIVQPTYRSGYDKPTSWGNPIGKHDHRMRPSSSPGTRHFDDKTPFFSHTAHISFNFDEDERKPLDGIFIPRKTVSDEGFRVSPAGFKLSPEYDSAGRMSVGQVSASYTQASRVTSGSYSGGVAEFTIFNVGSRNVGGNNGHPDSVSHPNVWEARKEVAMGLHEPMQSSFSERSAMLKLATASALDKVSSGRWHSKYSTPSLTDAESIGVLEAHNGTCAKKNNHENPNRTDPLVMGYPDGTLARHVESILNIEDVMTVGGEDNSDYDRNQAPCAVFNETKQAIYGEGYQLTATEVQSLHPSDGSQQPKLNLLPRTKPFDNQEGVVVDMKRSPQQLSDSADNHFKVVHSHGNVNPAHLSLAESKSGNQTTERPKLNLKPRSQPVGQVEAISEKERNSLFGGARPREMVLKERGTAYVPISNPDMSQRQERVQRNVPRVHEQTVPPRRGERTDNPPADRKKSERNNRSDGVKVDTQRRNRENDNWRYGRETERQQHQQQKERQPSPETWLKPLEQQPKLASHGKAVSSVELAQAFSRAVSDRRLDDRYSTRRSTPVPVQTQIPFSRLIAPNSRQPQINGPNSTSAI